MDQRSIHRKTNATNDISKPDIDSIDNGVPLEVFDIAVSHEEAGAGDSPDDH